MSFRRRTLAIVPALALVVGVFGWPVLQFLSKAFTEPQVGLQNFRQVVQDDLYLKVLWNTVVISATTTGIAALLGYPLAYTLANTTARVRRLLIFVVLIPFWTSLLVRTFAWMVLLQPQGLVNDILRGIGIIERPLELVFNRTGLLIGMVQVQLPFMIFPMYSVMARIDPALTRAAHNLGAGPAMAFLRIYFPLSLPGVLTGMMLVFVTSLGYFITPALLGGIRDVMIAEIIQEQIADSGVWGVPAVLSLILLCGTLSLLFVANRTVRATKA
jgi:putative spermidine/putrescine transport system permease protein